MRLRSFHSCARGSVRFHCKLWTRFSPAIQAQRKSSSNPNIKEINMGSYVEPNTPMASHASEKSPAKATHVNMMTDTIIANMPPEGLRTVMRGLLGVNPRVTTKLNALAVEYLAATRPTTISPLFEDGEAAPALFDWQWRYRCLMGCGICLKSWVFC
jgi:hypothetical protein